MKSKLLVFFIISIGILAMADDRDKSPAYSAICGIENNFRAFDFFLQRGDIASCDTQLQYAEKHLKEIEKKDPDWPTENYKKQIAIFYAQRNKMKVEQDKKKLFDLIKNAQRRTQMRFDRNDRLQVIDNQIQYFAKTLQQSKKQFPDLDYSSYQKSLANYRLRYEKMVIIQAKAKIFGELKQFAKNIEDRFQRNDSFQTIDREIESLAQKLDKAKKQYPAWDYSSTEKQLQDFAIRLKNRIEKKKKEKSLMLLKIAIKRLENRFDRKDPPMSIKREIGELELMIQKTQKQYPDWALSEYHAKVKEAQARVAKIIQDKIISKEYYRLDHLCKIIDQKFRDKYHHDTIRREIEGLEKEYKQARKKYPELKLRKYEKKITEYRRQHIVLVEKIEKQKKMAMLSRIKKHVQTQFTRAYPEEIIRKEIEFYQKAIEKIEKEGFEFSEHRKSLQEFWDRHETIALSQNQDEVIRHLAYRQKVIEARFAKNHSIDSLVYDIKKLELALAKIRKEHPQWDLSAYRTLVEDYRQRLKQLPAKQVEKMDQYYVETMAKANEYMNSLVNSLEQENPQQRENCYRKLQQTAKTLQIRYPNKKEVIALLIKIDKVLEASRKQKQISESKIVKLPTSKPKPYKITGKRVALVIGNGNYDQARLKNPLNDAKDISQALKLLGFQVTLKTNITRREMRKAIRRFGRQLNHADVGLFYYAGHGMQVKGINYLIPVRTDIETEDEVEDEAVDAGLVLRKMEKAKNPMNIVILDACRNNPFARSFRSGNKGLAQMDAPKGSLIIYATAPGSTAEDGRERNGTFTKHFLRHMATPGLEVSQVLKRVTRDVANATQDRQIPWRSSSLMDDFYFLEK